MTSKALQPAPSKAPTPVVVDVDEISGDTTDGGDTFFDHRAEGEAKKDKTTVLTTADDFEIDTGGRPLTEFGERLVGGFKEKVVDHGIELDAANDIYSWFQGVIDGEVTKRAAADKAARKRAIAELADLWGDDFGDRKDVLDAKIGGLDAKLRKALMTARTDDGRLLIYASGFIELLLEGGGVSSTDGGLGMTTERDPDEEQALRAELREINTLLQTDRDKYFQPWKGTRLTADMRKQVILAEMEARVTGRPRKTEAQNKADTAADIKRLLALKAKNPEVFEYREFKAGMTGAQYLDRIYASGT